MTVTYKLLCIAYIILTPVKLTVSTQAPRYQQPLTHCMRKKILGSANAKYHYFYLFFYKINKEDLPLMYSCVFWCEFIDLVGFFLAVIV